MQPHNDNEGDGNPNNGMARQHVRPSNDGHDNDEENALDGQIDLSTTRNETEEHTGGVEDVDQSTDPSEEKWICFRINGQKF